MASIPLLPVLGAVLVLAVLIAVIVLVARSKKSASDSTPANGKDPGKPVEIYVGNLAYAMTDEQLSKEFERFGVVKSARVVTHRASGKSKGYGFVEMPHRKEAEIAIKSLHAREVMGRKLRVNEAKRGIPKP